MLYANFTTLQIDDATRALEATNGTKFERNGQVLRVAYAKSIHGPSVSGGAQSSSLAAAAIEAASFAQQVYFFCTFSKFNFIGIIIFPEYFFLLLIKNRKIDV